MALNEILIEFSRQSGASGSHAYLLLDGAHHEGANFHLDRSGIAYESLFEGYAEAAFPEIAPLLVQVSGLNEPQLDSLTSWAMDLGLQFPTLSWMGSSLAAPVLASHLRLFHSVGLSDNQRMLMRWYDTRILPIWIAALNREQLDLFSSPLTSLSYLNRFGEVTHLDLGTSKPHRVLAPSGGRPLIALDDRQYAMLVEASTLDTLIQHLRNIIKDETNQITNRLLTEFVAKYQQRAIAAGLDDINRQTQYLLLALYTSGAGVEHPACRDLMQSPPVRFEDFFERMQQLPDAAWEMGPPLWGENPEDVLS